MVGEGRPDGIGFGPQADSPGLGLGIPTIAALADTMSVDTTEGGGTRLCRSESASARRSAVLGRGGPPPGCGEM